MTNDHSDMAHDSTAVIVLKCGIVDSLSPVLAVSPWVCVISDSKNHTDIKIPIHIQWIDIRLIILTTVYGQYIMAMSSFSNRKLIRL